MIAEFQGHGTAQAAVGAAVSFVECTFANNSILESTTAGAIIEAQASANFPNTTVRLEQCGFESNAPVNESAAIRTLLADHRQQENSWPHFYSDSSSPAVCNYFGADSSSVAPPCEMTEPRPLLEAGSGFLDPSNVWLQQVKQVRMLKHA